MNGKDHGHDYARLSPLVDQLVVWNYFALQNLPPSAGMQFFGHVKIDGATGQMTVTLRDRADVALWSTTLDPKPV